MDGHAESALHAPRRESIAQALHTRRLAEATLRHSFLDPERPAYQRAIAVVLADLRRFGSVADLVEILAFLLASVRAALRSRRDLVVENALLRHQLAVLTRPTANAPGFATATTLAGPTVGC